jgi:uncharacterized DUF497 family protein
MYTENNPIYEWDVTKAELNKLKHKITFEEAASVFLDEFGIEERDHLHSKTEERFHYIGQSEMGAIFTVTYTLRGNGRVRIISARLANKKERQWYDKNIEIYFY